LRIPLTYPTADELYFKRPVSTYRERIPLLFPRKDRKSRRQTRTDKRTGAPAKKVSGKKREDKQATTGQPRAQTSSSLTSVLDTSELLVQPPVNNSFTDGSDFDLISMMAMGFDMTQIV